MSISVDLSQLVALSARIKGAGPRVGAAGSQLLRGTAYRIEADAKSLAAVDTGALRSSITTTIAGDGASGSMTAEIGPTVEHGVYVELGTSRMAAQPYLQPAADRNIPGLVQGVEQLGASAL